MTETSLPKNARVIRSDGNSKSDARREEGENISSFHKYPDSKQIFSSLGIATGKQADRFIQAVQASYRLATLIPVFAMYILKRKGRVALRNQAMVS